MKSKWPAWFRKLSPEAQEAYVKAHPKTKLTKMMHSNEMKYARFRDGEWILHLKNSLKESIRKDVAFKKNPPYRGASLLSATPMIQKQLNAAVAEYRKKYGNR